MPNQGGFTDDTLFGGRLVLRQPAHGRGYRFNVDSLYLSFQALRVSCDDDQPITSVADLGAGCGVVGLSYALFHPGIAVTLIEKNNVMLSCASHNAARFEAARVLESDVASVAGLSVDLVLSNPPYTAPGRGDVAPESNRASARMGDVEPFLQATINLMHERSLAMWVYPCVELPQLLRQIESVGLRVRSLRLVSPRVGEPSRIALISMAKQPCSFEILPPWFERDDAGVEWISDWIRSSPSAMANAITTAPTIDRA